MNKTNISNTEENQSGFITSDTDIKIGVGGLMSEKYSNITEIHGSETSHFKLYSAVRYGKRYVLKGISKRFETDQLYQALLAKEFDLGISLDHPNIRRTIGFERIEGIGNVIVLEYIDGMTLEEYIRENRLNPDKAKSILGQVSSALEYLGSRQILHRDLKPANIMLTHSGLQVKLIDFSHADAESYVVLKDAAGTNRYIAPELLNESESPSIKTDIYSFGMVARDMAESSDNLELMEISKRCCNINQDLRPDSFAGIMKPTVRYRIISVARKFFGSKILTLILVLMILTIWCYIFFIIQLSQA